ncbi:MAG: manganese efflux pump MntP family protein [Phycisphaerae bacterium]|jgi:putative Mn2+ efflux pump MntP|nr:manganese efflux pump MntP family protein [Phycisphaerae bacterium]MDP7636263.1 manganese efflux pump MntP family protein [Phycisphaerae bacterium]
MGLLETLTLAVGLGLDAMSVCTGIGVRWHGPRQKFRLAWHMGLFQFLMPVIGWLAGRHLAVPLESVGAYLASALVMAMGAKMLYGAWKYHPSSANAYREPSDPTRGWSLLALSLATSIDAMVVGCSLGLKGEQLWQASVVIGVAAGLMAMMGVVLGRQIGQMAGRPAEFLGAAVLIALGISFLF